MKIGLISLGCAKNLVDSEMMLGLFKQANIEIVNKPELADVIVVNTCGFIEDSKVEAINTIFEMVDVKNKCGNKLVVTGCLVERYKEDLEKEIPEVDAFIPIRDYARFGSILSSLFDTKLAESLSPTVRLLSTPPYWAYLRISDGCDNRCTYCAIPLIRKGHVSRPYDALLEEADILAKKGVKELVLISQDTTRYGRDINNDKSLLPNLLEDLVMSKKFDFIRFLYLYPDEIQDELLDVVAKYDCITPYFDVPIQHASTKVLTRMNRRGNKDFLQSLFKKIKEKVPNAILRTTLIVGFPGETDEDFNELIEFINEVKFDKLGVFKYSPEEGTVGATFEDQIPDEIKSKRYIEVVKAQEKIALECNKKHKGTIHKTLVTGFDHKKNMYIGRSYAFAPDDVDGVIFFTSEQVLREGDIVNVLIENYFIHDLIGKRID